jgi:hypothetical protein
MTSDPIPAVNLCILSIVAGSGYMSFVTSDPTVFKFALILLLVADVTFAVRDHVLSIALCLRSSDIGFIALNSKRCNHY